jgi:Family of unknown function (DUF6328)
MTTDRDDADPGDGRDESVNERMDRNWIELLQETRVTQTGTQILSGFLLTIVFQPTFADLDVFDKTVYLCLVVLATLTTALALAPVALHRSLFRHHSKPVLVQASHLLLRAALVGLALVMVGAVLLIVDVATGDRTTASVVAGGVAVTLLLLASLPLLVRNDRVRDWLERAATGQGRS